MRGVALGLCFLLVVAEAHAQPRVAVRTGDHPGLGRMVFDWPAPPAYQVEQVGDRVILRFPNAEAIELSGARRLPRNVLAVAAIPGGVELTLRPGARIRHFRNGPKVAIDVLDPVEASTPQPRLPMATPPATATATPLAITPPATAAPAIPASAARASATPASATPGAVARRLLETPAARNGAAAIPQSAAPQSPISPPLAAQPMASRVEAPAPVVPAPVVPVPAAPIPAARVALPPAASGATAAVPAPGVASSAEASPTAPLLAAPGIPTPPQLVPSPTVPSLTVPPPTVPSPTVPPPTVPSPLASRPAAPQQPAMLPPGLPAGQPWANSLAGPPPIRARQVEEAGQGPTLRLPIGAAVGAAALRRGEQALLLIETERPIEFGALAREAGFGGIQARALPGATLITWPLAMGMQVILRPEGNDWFVSLVPRQHPAAMAVPALRVEQENGRTSLHAPRPSRIVALTDPMTGVPLLVGLVGQAAPRQFVTRAMAELDLLETFLGVAVLARADRVALRLGVERFVLSIEGGGIALAPTPGEGQAANLGLTRSFDLPAQTVPALLERLRAQQSAVASAAPLLRMEPRIAAAQTLLSLGLPQEAQAMLRLATEEDPAAALDHRLAFLSGMAAMIAGRPNEASGLDAELPVTDEILLWRHMRSAMQADAARAAPGLAATWPLLPAYPEGLRRRLIGPAAEAMIEGGAHAAGRRLMESSGDEPGLLLAQAMLEEATGEPARALEGYEAAANGRDRLMRARALRRGIELRLATGRLDAAGAARALEATLFAWRGDELEITTRMRVAALRRDAGEPRAALALLRDTEAQFPEQAANLRAPIAQAFLHALETEPPLGAIALHDAHPELLPMGPAGEAVLALLTERLTALDLPDRAAALLRRAMERAPPGEHRAALGARLATQRLAERDADGALGALAASSAPRLPPGLLEARSLLAARAEARRGNRTLAAEALQALGPAGDETLADILAEAQDFAGAAAALGRHLAASAPQGILPEAPQRVVLRQAALLAMAGDEAALAALRARYAPRMPAGAPRTAFDALTTDPVRGLADLPRLARELNLFRSLPQRLEPLRTAQRPAG